MRSVRDLMLPIALPLTVLALAVLVNIGCTPAQAATATATAPSPAGNPNVDRTLTTTAEAEVIVVPDQALMAFEISLEGDTAVATQRKTDGPIAKALAAAKAQDVSPEHLQTSVAQLSQRFVYDKRGNARVVGWTAVRTMTVRIVDLTKLDAIANAVVGTGNDIRVSNVSYEDSKMTEHKELARIKAAEAARAKAETLASKLGAKLGAPRSVSESGAPGTFGLENWRNTAYNDRTKLDAGGAVAGETFAPGRVTLTAGVHVVFDLIAG